MDHIVLFTTCIQNTILFYKINKLRLAFKQTDDKNNENWDLKKSHFQVLFNKHGDMKCILINIIKQSLIYTHKSPGICHLGMIPHSIRL